MKYTPKQYARALYESLQETDKADHEKVLDNFVSILRQNGDLGKFPEIESAINEYEKQIKGVKTAEVTTARPINRSEEERILKELNHYTRSKVEIKSKVDEGLVGGVVVKLGDELIDGSIKKNLQDLKNNLV